MAFAELHPELLSGCDKKIIDSRTLQDFEYPIVLFRFGSSSTSTSILTLRVLDSPQLVVGSECAEVCPQPTPDNPVANHDADFHCPAKTHAALWRARSEAISDAGGSYPALVHISDNSWEKSKIAATCLANRPPSVLRAACNGTSIAEAASAMQMPAHIKLISLLPSETRQHEERRAPAQQGVHTAGRQRRNKEASVTKDCVPLSWRGIISCVGPVWP